MWHPNYKFPESLKSADFLDCTTYFEHKFVLMHERIKSVQRQLELEFFSAREQHIALVIGPTGVGKSCLAHSLLSSCYKNIKDEERYKNLPMVYFEADVHSTGNFSWKDFYRRLLRTIGELDDIRVYGRPEMAGDYGARRYTAKNRSEADLKSDLQDRLAEYGVKYILLDEIQHIFKYGGKSAERSLDILKSISNKTGCRFIGLGTYEVSFSVDKSAQLSRRILTVEFPAYVFEAPNDLKQFQSAYMGLLAHIPAEMNQDIVSSVEQVFLGCCGCVGILKEWLNRALVMALNKSKPVSLEILRNTRLKGSQLKSIAQEISEGKVFFEEPDDRDIAVLLGLRGGDVDAVEKPSPSGVRPGNRRPGERNPVRDAVI